MANETDTGLVGPNRTAEVLVALAERPFDPATLLQAPPAPPLPYAVGLEAEVVHTFDPAANLGEAARRGPAMIGNGKPLVARIGGVEVVTIPLEHYAALLSPLALAGSVGSDGRQTAASAGQGALDLVFSLYVQGRVSISDIAQATRLSTDRIESLAKSFETLWDVHQAQADLGTSDEPSPLDITPSPEEAVVDLPPKVVEVPLTPADQANVYNAAAQSGDVRGGAMDREGKPAAPSGAGMAAYDAERGSQKRSRR